MLDIAKQMVLYIKSSTVVQWISPPVVSPGITNYTNLFHNLAYPAVKVLEMVIGA